MNPLYVEFKIIDISPCHIFFSSCNHKSWLVFLFTVTKHSPLKSLQNLDFYMDNLEQNILGHLFLIYQPANFQWQIIFFCKISLLNKKIIKWPQSIDLATSYSYINWLRPFYINHVSFFHQIGFFAPGHFLNASCKICSTYYKHILKSSKLVRTHPKWSEHIR